ncbi:MAG: rhodanese-like domain-containing protein [Xanthomonadales bacterium]|jgi:rhodanese-related sulfurtransferase|nr:rhodanese-like domain-containing protein [Xanthomonadales bacterium]
MIALLKSLFGSGVAACTASEAKALLDAGHACVIDVREAGEYAGGSVPGALHVPLSRLAARGVDALAGLPIPDAGPILLLCLSGARSRSAGAILAGRYAARLRNLSGGILAWSAAGFPVVRG